jgi:hypothetical protein
MLPLPSTTTAGSSVVANPYIDNDPMTSGEDLSYLLIGGYTQVAGKNLMSLSLDATNNPKGIDGVAGNRFRAAVTVGDHAVTGSFKLYHMHDISTVATALSRLGTRVPIDLCVADPAGNKYWMRLLKTILEPGATVPGAKGSEAEGSWNIKAQRGPRNMRTVTLQRFAAA